VGHAGAPAVASPSTPAWLRPSAVLPCGASSRVIHTHALLTSASFDRNPKPPMQIVGFVMFLVCGAATVAAVRDIILGGCTHPLIVCII